MDLRALEAFHAVIEEGGVSAAAMRLGLTQPAVSARLRSLERSFGRALFHRCGNRLELTAAGRELRARTEAFARAAREVDAYLAQRGRLEAGELTLGADGPFDVMPLVAAFRSRHPGVRVRIEIGNTEQVRRQLERGRVDAAVLMLAEDAGRFRTLAIGEDRLAVLLPAGHELCDLPRVPLARLVAAPLVLREPGSMTRSLFEQACRERGLEVRPGLELGSREAVREAVVAGLGLGVVFAGEQPPDPRVALRPFAGFECRIARHLAALPERSDLRISEELFRIAQALAVARRPASETRAGL